jgi:hypothetical protein
MSRKPKVQSLTDLRIYQTWTIQPDENGLEQYVCSGWELQVQRGTDEWEKLDVVNVVVDPTKPPIPEGNDNG